MLRTLATWVKPWRTLSSGRCPERASPRKLFRAVVQVITARLPGLEQVVEALLLGGPWLPAKVNFQITLFFFFSVNVSCSVMSESHNRMHCSPPSSSVCGILQARILGWLCHSFL